MTEAEYQFIISDIDINNEECVCDKLIQKSNEFKKIAKQIQSYDLIGYERLMFDSEMLENLAKYVNEYNKEKQDEETNQKDGRHL